MSINIQNNNQANVVLNNTNNVNLNITNSNQAKSYVEVNNGSNNNINILNSEKKSELFSDILIFLFIVLFTSIYFLSPFSKKKTSLNVISSEEKKDDFELLKEELNFLVSKKFVSKNVLDRITVTITELELKYYENKSLINTLKYKEDTLVSLKEENINILNKLKYLIENINIDNNPINLENIDDLLSFIKKIEKAKKGL